MKLEVQILCTILYIYTYMGRIPSARCCEVLGKINLIKKKKKNNNTSFVKDIPMSKSIKNGLFRYSQRVPMLESYFCGVFRERTPDSQDPQCSILAI